MGNFDLFFERMVEEDMQFIEALLGPTEDVVEPFNEYLDKEIEKREKCEQNNKSYEADWSKIDEFMEKYEKARKLSSQLISKLNSTTESDEKENTPTEEEEIPSSTSTASSTTTNGRPKRAAFREASQMINKQVNVKLNNKLRREDVSEEKSSLAVVIKTEKQSEKLKNIDDNKKNDMEEMPPPKSLPIKKRPNRRIKKEQLDMSVIAEDELSVDINDIKHEKDTRNSDVVIQEPKISLVDLTIPSTISSSTITTTTTITSAEPNNDDDSRRGTYVIDKNVNKKQPSEKRIRDVAVDDDDNVEKSSSKRPKSNSTIDKDVDNKNNDSTSTHYDDAISNDENFDLVNATFIAGPSFKENTNKKLMNTTVVVQKSQQSPNIPDGLLTDDESDHEQQSKSNTKHVKSSKQVFSAFEQSPVKKKVEAFEKLNSAPVDIPVRVTRTKTKVLEKQQEQQPSTQRQQNLANNSTKLLPVNNVKEKAKLFASPTPKSLQKTVKKLETTTTTAAANKRKVGETHQKENDAKEKREARMQQIIEERRRKREEKELKAQQQREIIEREKLKQIEEQERLKEERYKRLLLEQEQKKQKQREENERKRLLIREKAQKLKQQAVEKPKYLTMETPRLPTDDCYDSDEEDYRKIKIQVPTWCKDQNLCAFQFSMSFFSEKIKNAFFSRQAQTVDLTDLFQTNNPRILKRTSSAHWTKPPKYSILPTHLENSVECSEHSGDD